ncbi:uncharacterized protein LOC134716907 [Mytilus trossulus]|uniref:uncharacterized protein LOC134716907 n=1 Tax=Mytilus trossulus TaxID=6551 RepID=UPI003004A454
MRALLDIPAPHDTLESLRTFHDKSEAYIRGLESLGQCQNSYSNKHHIETEQSQNKVDTETSMLYTASEERSTVLLKTAFIPVVHKNTCIDARILFDEGAQRSFITEELAAKLDITKEGSETLSIATFGSTTKKVRNLDKTTINLKSTEGELIPIKVLIVPTIASPLQTHNIGITQKFSYLRGLQLAHPVMEGEQFEISLLIGGDFYWDIVQDKIVRGNGPTAVSSKIGYLLSGPVPTRTSNASFSMMNILVCHKQGECDLEKFWKLESLGIDAKEQNDPDLAESIENNLQTSITKKNDKYITKLPWRENAPELPTNENIAKRRTESVIRRLKKDPEMFRKYSEIITDQEQRGFIEKVCDESTCTNKIQYTFRIIQ